MSPSAGTPATATLRRAGIAFTTHNYVHDPRSTEYGLEAARALDLDPSHVFKTLIASVDGVLTVAVVPVTGSLDLKALATVRGGRRAAMADAMAAQRSTGYVLGGISPVGQKRPLPTVLDSSAANLDVIYVSGGKRGFDIGIAPDDLLTVTGGTLGSISRGARP